MGMNRYDNGSVSAYTPQTMQELAFVPMMQRQKHDALLAQQESIRAGLAKVDPYDKHFDEAVKLKKDIESQIDAQAEELAKHGVSNDMTGKVISLNRQYQDLISPTGKLGQINAEKQNILKINEEYDKLGKEKGWGQDRINYWKEKALQDYNQTSVYDKNNKILKYTGPKDIANKIDLNKRLDDLATHAGMTTEEFKQGLPIAVGQDESGYFTQGHQMSGWSKAKNRPQVTAAYNMLIKELNDPTSEVRKSANYEGRNLNNLQDILGTQKEIYMKDSKSNESDYTLDHFGSGPNKTKDPTSIYNDAIQDPTSIQNLDKDIHDIDFTDIGKNRPSTGPAKESAEANGQVDYSHFGGKYTYKDILNPLQRRFYETASKRLIANGKLPKNANIDDPKNAAVIGFYLKNHMKFPTVANDIVRADVAIDNKLFTGNLASKDQNSRNATLKQDVEGDYPLRTMVDVKTGKKIKLEEGDTVDYLGVDSPINYRNYNFGNNRAQSVMAHRAHVLDKDGNVKANVAISRSPNEMDDQNFKNIYDINQTYKNAIEHLGEWRRPAGKFSGNKNISKISIKINDDNTIQIKRDDSQYPSRPLNNEEFLLQMDSLMNQ